MDFMKAIGIAASGLRAQSGRMRVISENIANADSEPKSAGAEPYRRKVPTFANRLDRELDASVVELGRVRRDQSPFRTKHEPGNPAADANGEVRLPNVNLLVETVDMREAQRSYEANLNMITAARRMISRTIDILKV
ncbi:flagellar basal body rod protein FlgC [Methylobacterium nodulans]|uniref:Flagellar basal-body rod protein FlgC n=1 Tax=Methylobacterium nodulans (strain LMG 21967 / CNCM I-2342 / ORS 2060) TaxID=460265 RepID=B8IP61_METNO|nr:flagellar basal body rod protein FlgC [Methylobacterium nodulans]ACL60379.1 flagellar basal-body rod protein FlgC [Methylobacterium nodulans ORS 2060]